MSKSFSFGARLSNRGVGALALLLGVATVVLAQVPANNCGRLVTINGVIVQLSWSCVGIGDCAFVPGSPVTPPIFGCAVRLDHASWEIRPAPRLQMEEQPVPDPSVASLDVVEGAFGAQG